jgi:RNA polymerase sigma factor (TIGR02999 family)
MALVHEAYLRLVDTATIRGWDSRGHFFAAAAEAMRRILVERARRRRCLRHGGGLRRRDLSEPEVAVSPTDDEPILELDEALDRLAAARPQAAELVKLRFFSGLTAEEAAPMVGLSPRSAHRLWAFARASLRRDMERSADPEP